MFIITSIVVGTIVAKCIEADLADLEQQRVSQEKNEAVGQAADQIRKEMAHKH